MSSVSFTLSESPAPHGSGRSERDRLGRHPAADLSCLSKSLRDRRRLVPQLSSMDLLPDLDPARPACVWRRSRGDREISTAMVATVDESCDLALAAWARADQFRVVVG